MEKRPLSDRMRPSSLEEFVGQEHLLGEGKPIRRMIEEGKLTSMVLWGPPGSGKTTLAYIIAQAVGAYFVAFSAVTSGVKEIREVISQAKSQRDFFHKQTILFVDEIHHFNKSQQDAFLPHIESGLIILIGATTENPSFELNRALLSRLKIFVLNPLSPEHIRTIIKRALEDPKGLGNENIELTEDAMEVLTELSSGDARVALDTLEMASYITEEKNGKRKITPQIIETALQKHLPYDKSGEEHYNLISAFHKSIRGGDPDAALYWLARMLESGEDPLYIARRMVVIASEDVGNADPHALPLAIAGKDAYEFLGSPEGELALAQVAVYLATAPKSNAVYKALSMAREDVRTKPRLPVPLHIRNAPTDLMKKLGYGKGYKYAHNFPGGYTLQEYMPENLRGREYYHPTNRGAEGEIKKRLERWRALKRKGGK